MNVRRTVRAFRLLYVDDDRINALLFEEMVRASTGIEIDIAGLLEQAAGRPLGALVVISLAGTLSQR